MFTMILSDVRRYLRQNKQASLDELSQHFSVEPEAMRGMLEHLIAKGLVYAETAKQMEETNTACGQSGGCGGCSSISILCPSSQNTSPQKSEIFRWTASS